MDADAGRRGGGHCGSVDVAMAAPVTTAAEAAEADCEAADAA